MNRLLAEKEPNDNCCSWDVLTIQIREQLFSPDYSHHLPFQRVYCKKMMVTVQGYRFRSSSSLSDTRALQKSQVQRFRNLRFFSLLCIYAYTCFRVNTELQLRVRGAFPLLPGPSPSFGPANRSANLVLNLVLAFRNIRNHWQFKAWEFFTWKRSNEFCFSINSLKFCKTLNITVLWESSAAMFCLILKKPTWKWEMKMELFLFS